MIDHLFLKVRDYEASKRFYLAALKPLGYDLVLEFDRSGGFGAGGKPDLWLEEQPRDARPTHVAFAAASRKAVEAFYEAATAAGGRDNGKPGLRTHYHPTYYAAFVLDPDGNNVEAVVHAPE
jgi:catechol 2,3-dioxygenase-like lactoylglutathione lyase family enzyme